MTDRTQEGVFKLEGLLGAVADTWWESGVGGAVGPWRQQVAALAGRPPRAGGSGPDQVLPGRSRVDSLRSLNGRTADIDFLHSSQLSASVCIALLALASSVSARYPGSFFERLRRQD